MISVRARNQLAITLSISFLATLTTLFPTSLLDQANASGVITYNDGVCDLALGAGTIEDPFQISSPETLWEVTDCSFAAGFPDMYLGGGPIRHFLLTQPIDVSQALPGTPTHSPIGYMNSGDAKVFRGVLDGGGNRIFNIHMSTNHGAGLFAILSNASIKRLEVSGDFETSTSTTQFSHSAGVVAIRGAFELNFDGVTVSGSVSGNRYVGGLIGHASYADISISNSQNLAAINGVGYTGGLVGGEWTDSSTEQVKIYRSQNHGLISSVFVSGGLVGEVRSLSATEVLNTGNLFGDSYQGGLVGSVVSNASISHSRNQGNISATSLYAAGLVAGAFNQRIDIHGSENQGNIHASGRYAGGLVALAHRHISIDSSTNSGRVSAGQERVGGLIAWQNLTGEILNSANTGQVSGSFQVGGLVGYGFSTTTISASLNSGEVLGGASSGGFVGYASSSVEIQASFNSGAVSGGDAVGGLVGSVENGAQIRGSENSGAITGGDEVGGLIGFHQEGGIAGVFSSQNHGAISGSEGVGGLVGRSENALTVSSSENVGSVTGSDWYVGGLVGWANQSAIISHSRNQGTISGERSTGGIIGWANQVTTVSQSVNTGNISGHDYVGGLIGWANQAASIQSSQNSGSASGEDRVGGLIGWANERLSVLRSINSGAIAGDDYVGGLIGYARVSVLLTNTANSGSVSGLDYIGGLAGRANGTPVGISFSYNSGALTSGNSKDGLVAFGSPTLTSVFTTEPSGLTETTEIGAMQRASIFTDWDFDSIWGFGVCTEAGGLPLLREFGAASTYQMDGCLLVAESPVSDRPAPYQGPILYAIDGQIEVGSKVELFGRRLGTISELSIGGTKQAFQLLGDTSLSFTLSKDVGLGVQDVVVVSGFGTLTLQSAMVVTEAKVLPNAVTTSPLIGKTKVLARDTSLNSSWFSDNLQNSGIQRIVCTVAVEPSGTLHKRVQARKTAKASCEAAAQYLQNPSIWFQTKSTAHPRFVGRAFLTVKG